MSEKIIIDVRTIEEYANGHIEGSMNIPLQEIVSKESDIIALKKHIVFCCASGNRSGHATECFLSKGISCENGGSWFEVASNYIV